MPQPGAGGPGANSYLPYPTGGVGNNFPPYPTSSFGSFPPYPTANSSAQNMPGYPPYMGGFNMPSVTPTSTGSASTNDIYVSREFSLSSSCKK